MNRDTLIDMLNQEYDSDQTWLGYIKESHYDYNCITQFCNEMEINLAFYEEHSCDENYLCAKTWINFSPTISGWFEFDSECDIDNSADENEFIDKLQKLLEEVAFIHSEIRK